ncbi:MULTISPECIES: SRPBCC family protein [unclassified Amycolatopsis]|uniref:SRPBCC family protein n=1 Tax=unclassified Amycolatopsis TaxID=2618356 RepID=UPI001FF27A03|nr:MULTISPECIES: SRPBCC family protein [unclassified Amycolatopsis]UOZ03781.1 SRPBCC family protein [Amycolatopsis sp. WQ 127309]WSJ79223.1 SRPBCC family protein [Amycolatopsis sp. NBC_01307]WSK77295.1 SRPBCC family protein [Amycolatopsis sp. NBC_01286]
MTEVSRVVDAPPQTVFAVLADGWSYGGWVVGSSHIRAVDAGWPAVGSRIHHSVGSWPLQLQDETTVVAVETGVSLSLEAKAWPTGAAAVGLTLVPHDGGTRTLVRMTEHVVRGPAKVLPEAVQGLLLRPRNAESLARLGDLAVGRRARVQP